MDASLGNLANGGTPGGHIIFLAGQSGRITSLCWNSKRIRRVVCGTLAGETLTSGALAGETPTAGTLADETLTMADGIDMGIFVATLYSEITVGDASQRELQLICFTNCMSLYKALKSTKLVAEEVEIGY